jgi:hypothetical protein
MALSDKWTLSQLRQMSRNELMDPNNRWWADAELNDLVDEWQMRLQEWFEFVWGSATVAVSSIGTVTNTLGMVVPAGTASYSLSAIATNILRPDAFYWVSSVANPTNTLGVRLSARDKQDMDILKRDWRNNPPTDPPIIVYQDSLDQIVLWPPPAIAGTLICEYPVTLCFFNDSTPMQIPAWTKYSCQNYVAYRAMLRTGPNQDIQRAMKYKALFQRQIQRYRRVWDAYLPFHYPSLRPSQPSDHYTIDILNPMQQTVIPP